MCQIDVHHIDGNHVNNVDDNLMDLCANCHRLVTKRQARGVSQENQAA